MQTAVETLPEDRVRISVEVPAADVDHAVEHAVRDLGRDLRVPGFRKGKVPPSVVRARLGDEVVLEEALRGHLPGWYGRALDSVRIEPIDRPEIDYEELPQDGRPFHFTATVQVPPAAQLPEDLRLEAVRPPVEVPEGLVEQELERLRVGAAQLVPAPEGAQAEPGQFVLIDFVGRINGRPIKDGSASDYLVQLGSGRLIGGMETEIVGMAAGETRDVTVTFPRDYGPAAISGKTAVFTVELKELKTQVLPELDDEFAKDVSEFDTLEELRADIERRARESAATQVEGVYRTAVLDALGRSATVDVPQGMISSRIQERLEQAERTLSQRGVSFETFLRSTGRTVAELAEELRPEAESDARQELALKAYADRLDITISDDELEDFVREEMAGEKDPEAAVEKILGGPSVEAVREDLRLRRALDRAVEIATPLDPPAVTPDRALEPTSTPAETQETAASAETPAPPA